MQGLDVKTSGTYSIQVVYRLVKGQQSAYVLNVSPLLQSNHLQGNLVSHISDVFGQI